MPLDILFAASLGMLTWTFLEYWIHRYLGHVHRHNIFAREHLRHHAEGDYFAPAWKKLAAAAVVATVLATAFSLALGPRLGVTGALSFVGTWLGYEWIHWFAHVHPGSTAYGRWVRRNHFTHHFHHPKGCHGVTTPLWDIVFGTWKAPPACIVVPDRVAMVWLVDDAGQLRPEFSGTWRLRGRRAARAAK
jgi:sterol desaturase/sphingolipid hydroxylase (fatty acid hydroxylase superfamily)